MGLLEQADRTVGEAASAFDAFKVWVALLVLVGTGGVLVAGPGDLPDALPAHRAVGAAVIALGVVFFAGFRGGGDAPGPVAARCRALVYALVFAFVGGLMGYTLGRSGLTAWQLSQEGVQVEATVGERDTSKLDSNGNLLVRHRLHFGESRPLVELGEGITTGQTVRVLHLPDDPATLRINPSGTGFADLVRDEGLVGTILAAIGVLFCLLALLFNLWTALVGPPSRERLA